MKKNVRKRHYKILGKYSGKKEVNREVVAGGCPNPDTSSPSWFCWNQMHDPRRTSCVQPVVEDRCFSSLQSVCTLGIPMADTIAPAAPGIGPGPRRAHAGAARLLLSPATAQH